SLFSLQLSLDRFQLETTGFGAATPQQPSGRQHGQRDQNGGQSKTVEQARDTHHGAENAAGLGTAGDEAGAGASQMHRVDFGRIRNHGGDDAADGDQQQHGGGDRQRWHAQ